MKYLSFLLVFLCSCAQFSCAGLLPKFPKSGGSGADDKKIYASVAKVSGNDGTQSVGAGTGFAVDDETMITAGHVCVSIYEGNVKGKLLDKVDLSIVHNNRLLILEQVMEIVAIDETMDICILKGDHGLVPLKFADFSKVEIGDKVTIVGAPLGFFPTKTVGYVTLPNMTRDGLFKNRLVVSAGVSPGNSGSPILNEDGEVIGLLIEAVGWMFNTQIALGQRGNVVLKYWNVYRAMR